MEFEVSRYPKLRYGAGTVAWAGFLALLWQDEGRVVPAWIKCLLAPALLCFCAWCYYPLVIEEIREVWKPKPRIVGTGESEKPLRKRPLLVLLLLGLMFAGAIFMSGYSFRTHTAELSVGNGETILTGKEARLWEFRRIVREHANSAPTRQDFTKELGDAWMESAMSIAAYLNLKDEAYNNSSFCQTCYEDTWDGLQKSVASFRVMPLNISEDDLID